MLWLIILSAVLAYLWIGVLAFKWFVRARMREYPTLAFDGCDLTFGLFASVLWPLAWPIGHIMFESNNVKDHPRIVKWAQK